MENAFRKYLKKGKCQTYKKQIMKFRLCSMARSGFKTPSDLLRDCKSTLIQVGEEEDYRQLAVSCLLCELEFYE